MESNLLYYNNQAGALTTTPAQLTCERLMAAQTATDSLHSSTAAATSAGSQVIIALMKCTVLCPSAWYIDPRDLETMGELYLFPTLEEVHASAIVVDERVRHLLVLTDPDVQLEEPDAEEEFDPGVATRKLRPTQAERRLLERRRRRAERGDAPPIPPGPPGRGGDVDLPPPPAPLPPGGR